MHLNDLGITAQILIYSSTGQGPQGSQGLQDQVGPTAE